MSNRILTKRLVATDAPEDEGNKLFDCEWDEVPFDVDDSSDDDKDGEEDIQSADSRNTNVTEDTPQVNANDTKDSERLHVSTFVLWRQCRTKTDA